ncbi:RusA family crossover junction endodeoxyribonuclease [soil metagenome]
MVVEFEITPIGKVRMTQRDKWKQRPAVVRYYAFKDELVLKANLLRFHLPDEIEIEFHIPMPPSWSKKRQVEMLGQPHRHKPDADNMAKAVMDCLRQDDSGIWNIAIRKYWAQTGRIIITTA